MRKLIAASLVGAILLGGFAYWGLSTVAGRRRFDEMDGIIPAFAGLLAVMLGAAAVLLLLWNWWRSRRG